MAYTDIDKSDDYFNTVLYTGNGGTQSITGVGFKPDMVWLKNRDNGAYLYQRYDFIRGTTKCLFSSDNAEETISGITSFNSDGFSIGSDGGTNLSGNKFASWNWLASNTTGSNTNGSITSTVSANTTSGFSIVSYTGTGSTATVGHGLGVTPAMIIVKDRTNGGTSWVVWNKNFSSLTNNYLTLNTSNSIGTYSNYWGTSAPTSSVFGVGSGGLDNNRSSANIIAYCYAEKKGFSKFATYTGNGSSDGPYVYTGFKPAFILIKRTNSADAWCLFDNKRAGYNSRNYLFKPNNSDAEDTGTHIDLLSNGFKLRQAGTDKNASGGSYIYMAVAENPFVTSTGISACAR